MFGFLAFCFGTFCFSTFGRRAFVGLTLHFSGTFGFNTLGLGALGLVALQFSALPFQAFGLKAFSFQALRLELLGFDALGFQALGVHLREVRAIRSQRQVERRVRRFGEVIAERGPARCQRAALGHARRIGLQAVHGVADQGRQLAHGLHGFGFRIASKHQQAPHPGFRRGEDAGHHRHFRHCERAVHRMDRAQQRIASRRRALGGAGQPTVDRHQVPGDLRVQDFQQQLVHPRRKHLARGLIGIRHSLRIGGRDTGSGGRIRLRLRGHFGGRGWLGLPGRFCRAILFRAAHDFRRLEFFLRLTHGFHRRGDFRLGQVRFRSDRLRRSCVLARGRGAQRRPRLEVLAGGNPLHIRFQRREVKRDAPLALERGQQDRQRVESVVDDRQHRGAGRAGAVQHPVQQALHLPAELTQRAGAHEAAAPLEGVEDAPDRPQPLHVLGLLAPRRQEGVEVVDFLSELFQEDFADLVVDLVAGGFEAAAVANRCRCAVLLWRLGLFNCRVGHGGCFGPAGLRRRLSAASQGCDCVGGVFRMLDALVGRGGGRLNHGVPIRIRRFRHGFRFKRQRPVSQRLQALPGNVEDGLAVGAVLAHRLQVVLQARQGVGQRVQLAPVGHPTAAEQFVLGETAHARQEVRGLLQLEHAQRAGYLGQQPRHFDQLTVVPAGLDERHEGLSRISEIGNGLAGDDFRGLARLAGQRILLVGGVPRAELGNLLVQRRVHIEQRAGDIEQGVLAGGTVAADDPLHRVALFQHHSAGHAQPQHAQGVGDPGEHFHLRLQPRRRALAGAQVQVQCILHPQQVFLDRAGDGIEQRAVASAQAALGMAQLGFAGRGLLQVERFAKLGQRRVVTLAAGHVEQDLAGGFQRHVGTGERVLATDVPLCLTGHAGKSLAQARVGRDRACGQRLHRPLCHPQHAAHGLFRGVRQQGFQRGYERVAIGWLAAFRPQGHLRGEGLQAFIHAGCSAVPGGQRDAVRHRPPQVGREQHAFAQARRAAGGAQLVEQRQQHDRDVLVPALQPLQVIGQQHRAAHQAGAGGFALGDLAFLQRLGQAFHLFGHHGRRVQLHHPQGALHLVQVSGTEAHPAGIGWRLDERLDLQPRLGQGLVKLRLDPPQRGVVDRVAQRGGHRAFPHGSALPLLVLRP